MADMKSPMKGALIAVAMKKAAEAKGQEPSEDDDGPESRADMAAQEFVSSPSAKTFKALMDLCNAVEYPEE